MKDFIKRYIPLLVALLPVLIFRDFSPGDELRYISIANEAIAQNHWFAFTYQNIPYADVQPLYIWLLRIFKFIFLHHRMWGIGLLSLIPALGILWIMNRWIKHFDLGSMRLKDGSQSRLLAQLMLSVCGIELAMSFYLRMEMLASLFITLALYNFWKMLYRPLGPNDLDVQPQPLQKVHHHNQYLFALYTFLAIFTHGATCLYLIFICTIAYLIASRNFKLIGRVWNWRVILILAAAIGLWFYAVKLEGGDTYFAMMLDKLSTNGVINATRHIHPWYYLILSVWAITLPWGPLCLIAIGYTLYKKHALGTPLQSFFLTVILCTLTMFSCFPGKLEVYLLPAVPYIVYLGVMQFKQWQWPVRWQWPIIHACRIMLVLVFIAGCLTPWYNPYSGAYGDLCHKAYLIHKKDKTEHYYVYRLKRSDGMDAYLHEDIIKASVDDIAEGKLQNTLLLLDKDNYKSLNKELDKLQVPDSLRGTVARRVGPYMIIKFK